MSRMKLGELVRNSVEFLRDKGIEEPEIEVALLIAHALKIDRTKLCLSYDRYLSAEELSTINELLTRRAKHEPIQYIMGETEFMSFTFLVNPSVFIPRPETEIVVMTLIEQAKLSKSPVIFDIGTGSGVIGISVLKFIRNAFVYASDIAPLDVAHENAGRLGVKDRIKFLRGSLFEPFRGSQKADFIVSNPPYVKSHDIEALQPEIREFEPRESLDGGKDGMKFIKSIIEEAQNYLRRGGTLILEIGNDNSQKIKDMAVNFFKEVRIVKDLANKDRVLVAR
ncbi:MAG TPA: peptide chain release factor N(5)-glutamine methyltransferase [bacterium (Candidatus Stahlbacteria)]|nr:peptide chain release factor N(5)-glutamine methyltransferase [Candidatus Stahlbacteria bacterium]